MTEDKDDLNKALLDDDDLAQALESEYKKATSEVSDLRRQKVWNKIEEKAGLKSNKKPWYKSKIFGTMLLANAAAFFFLVIMTVQQETGLTPIQQLKGKGAGLVDADIIPFTMDKSGDPIRLDLAEVLPKVGDPIVIAVNSSSDGLASLVKILPGGQFERLVSHLTLRAGEEVWLMKNGQLFGVLLEEKPFQVCLVVGRDDEELESLVSRFYSETDESHASDCIELGSNL